MLLDLDPVKEIDDTPGHAVGDLRTGTVDHVELLLRLRDPDDGLAVPALFLSLAEQPDLACDVGRRMLPHAADLARSRPGHAVRVDVSGRTPSDPPGDDRVAAPRGV